MGIIADVIAATDEIMVDYVTNVFNAISAPLQATLALAGGLSLIFVAINHIYNVRSVTYAVYIAWAVRYACIVAFATLLPNFEFLRSTIVETPLSYATATIASVKTFTEERYDCGNVKGPLGLIKWGEKWCYRTVESTTPLVKDAASVNQVLDAFIKRIFDVGSDLFDRLSIKPSSWKYIISGLLVYVIGLVFTMGSIFVLLMAKIGLSIMFGLAPLAISMLTFPQTRGYFSSWLSMTVGFALVPMIVMALMSVVLTVANKMVPGGDSFFGGNLAFILVATAALAFLFQVPHIASSLASISLPQMGTAAMAGAASRIVQVMRAPLQAKAAVDDRAWASTGAMQAASANGKGRLGTAYDGAKAMMQSSQYRADKANRKYTQSETVDRGNAKATNSIGRAASPGTARTAWGGGASSAQADTQFIDRQRNTARATANNNSSNNKPA